MGRHFGWAGRAGVVNDEVGGFIGRTTVFLKTQFQIGNCKDTWLLGPHYSWYRNNERRAVGFLGNTRETSGHSGPGEGWPERRPPCVQTLGRILRKALLPASLTFKMYRAHPCVLTCAWHCMKSFPCVTQFHPQQRREVGPIMYPFYG